MAARKRVGELDMAFGRLLITPRSAVTEIEGQYCPSPGGLATKKCKLRHHRPSPLAQHHKTAHAPLIDQRPAISLPE